MRAFQASHGLVVDGVVGEQTWSKLIITVRRGDTGPAVMAVQQYWAWITVDGDSDSPVKRMRSSVRAPASIGSSVNSVRYRMPCDSAAIVVERPGTMPTTSISSVDSRPSIVRVSRHRVPIE